MNGHGAHCSRWYVFLRRNFLKSKWGMYVFQRSQYEEVYKKNLIVIILIDKLEKKDIPMGLRKYLKRNSYIDAIENSENVTERLRLVT